MSDYYTPSGTPVTDAEILSANLRAEFALIEDGTDKLPTLSVGNASKPIRVNAAGNALEAFSGGGTHTPTVVPPCMRMV